MFQDREKALKELQKQLLDVEDPQPQEEDLPQEIYDEYALDVHAYNTDTADTDLDAYSDDVFETPPRKGSLVLWFVLLTAAILLALAWFMAKAGGLL